MKDGAPVDDVLVFPLTNVLGEIRGLQVRAMDRDKKAYSDFFHGQGEPVTFGLGEAARAMWERRAVWLVEGVFDHFPVERHYPATLALLSVKTPPALIRLLRRLVDTVYVGYDMDRPGRAAAEQFRRQHGRDFQVRVIDYPAVKKFGTGKIVKDPGDLWEAWGDGPVGAFVQKMVKGAFDGEGL